MTPEQIRTAIAAPAVHALLPDTAAIAAVLSAGRTKVASVARNEFAIWAGSTGIRAKVEDHAANAASPLRSISLTIIDFLRGAAESLDLSKASNQAMLAAWVSAQQITQAQADELISLATLPDPVSEFDVRCAIFNDDGSLAV